LNESTSDQSVLEEKAYNFIIQDFSELRKVITECMLSTMCGTFNLENKFSVERSFFMDQFDQAQLKIQEQVDTINNLYKLLKEERLLN